MSLWLIGGLDPTGGAGILRDFATASALAPGLPVRCIVTTWTRQGHGAPAQVEPISPAALDWQLQGLVAPRAVKIGLTPAVMVASVVRGVQQLDVPIVVDPVLRATDGGELGSTATSLEPLLQRATLITPNLDEARALTGGKAEDGNLLTALSERFPEAAILLKNGHSGDPNCVVDRLCSSEGVRELIRPRVAGRDPRGTGCALATAIACRLAEGASLDRAVDDAVAWLDEARGRAVGQGAMAHLPSQ